MPIILIIAVLAVLFLSSHRAEASPGGYGPSGGYNEGAPPEFSTARNWVQSSDPGLLVDPATSCVRAKNLAVERCPPGVPTYGGVDIFHHTGTYAQPGLAPPPPPPPPRTDGGPPPPPPVYGTGGRTAVDIF